MSVTRRSFFAVIASIGAAFGISSTPDAYAVEPDGSVKARVGDRWFFTGETI